MKDRKAANERTNYADTGYIRIARITEKPDGPCRRGHKQDAVDLPPIQRMFVLETVFMVGVIWRRELFGIVGNLYGFGLFQFCLGHDGLTISPNS